MNKCAAEPILDLRMFWLCGPLFCILYAVDKGLRGQNILQIKLSLILLRICSRSVRSLIFIQCQMYRILHNLDCIKSTDCFTTKNRPLRSQPYSVIIPHSCTDVFKYSFFVNAPYLWPTLPSYLVQSSFFSAFEFQFTQILNIIITSCPFLH